MFFQQINERHCIFGMTIHADGKPVLMPRRTRNMSIGPAPSRPRFEEMPNDQRVLYPSRSPRRQRRPNDRPDIWSSSARQCLRPNPADAEDRVAKVLSTTSKGLFSWAWIISCDRANICDAQERIGRSLQPDKPVEESARQLQT